MSEMPLLDEALALALKLSPRERMRLIERVAASVEQEIDSQAHPADHWGQQLAALLNRLDLTDWQTPEMDDPVEWVKHIQQENVQRLDSCWDDSQ